ncbi:MAG: ArnT family glycosyltransferase [Planctomycetota bacterium]|jgi:hypothetical protein
MSKTIHKNRRSRRSAKVLESKSVGVSKQRVRGIVVLLVVVILAGIPFCMGKYFEFNSPGAYDSGSYVYSAAHILSGAEIGVDEVPSAKLGTLLVNIMGVWLWGQFGETGPNFMQMVFQAAALVLMFIAMRKLFGTLPASVGVIIASVFLSSPLIAKFGNVKEQYMIACMVIGMSCFVLYQLGGKWWWAVLAGGFVSWAPLFKETGTTVIGAIGLFVIFQPIFKHKSWKQTGVDLLLLLAGVVAAIGPLYVWILGWGVQLSLPYEFAWKTVISALPLGGVGDANATAGYVGGSRKLVTFSEQWPRVLRYYWMLILPIGLSLASLLSRIIRMVFNRQKQTEAMVSAAYDRFVLLFGLWWILDMAFVWISPRSYEQYYLPLTASAAMLSGYAIAVYRDNLGRAVFKGKWIAGGLIGLLLMLISSFHIFFGITRSPHSGNDYKNRSTGEIIRIKGYSQKMDEVKNRRRSGGKYPWEQVGLYIGQNSKPTDRIYVWGWYPGIYVAAQRFSSASKAVMMPRSAPAKFEQSITKMLEEFEANPPKFIVDSRKRHIPTSWPPMEIWPYLPRGFLGSTQGQLLPLDDNVIMRFEQAWPEVLRNKPFNCDEAEVVRFKMFKAVRDYVMREYRFVRMFGSHVLFELKPDDSVR